MLKYMLDTDISSYIMKRSNQAVLGRLAQTLVSENCISVVTKGELLFGVQRHPYREKAEASLDTYLRQITVLELSDGTAKEYADIRADLQARGRVIGGNDFWLAAHARYLNLTLVTNNTREFERVKGLKVENWTQ